MLEYKKNFLKFMVENDALIFGEVTLKSGRIAPYFINSGRFRMGRHLSKLGEYYASCFIEHHIPSKTLIGPAYKGIPLAVATASALFDNHGIDVGICFDRKEAKDHGEGGLFVGMPLEDGDDVCIIEDVMTSGKALREIMPKIKQEADVKVSSMIISVDRKERGLGEKSAVQEAYDEFGVRVFSIVTIDDILEGIEEGFIPGKQFLPKMRAYREEYGV